jgi:hypothetical protein
MNQSSYIRIQGFRNGSTHLNHYLLQVLAIVLSYCSHPSDFRVQPVCRALSQLLSAYLLYAFNSFVNNTVLFLYSSVINLTCYRNNFFII